MRAHTILALVLMCVPAAAPAGGSTAGTRCEPGCPPCASGAPRFVRTSARAPGSRCQDRQADLLRAVAATPATPALSAVVAASFRPRTRLPATLPPPPPGLERWQASRLYLVPPTVAIE